MIRRLICVLAALVALNATPGLAQTYNASTPTGMTHSVVDSGALAVFDTTDIATVNSIGVYILASTDHQRRFIIYSETDGILIFLSPPVSRSAGTSMELDTFELPSPVQLDAGKRYLIGAMSDSSAKYGVSYGGPSQTVSGPYIAVSEFYKIDDFTMLSTPLWWDAGRLEVSINQTAAAPDPATVPTLTEWAMILLFMGLAGCAALVLQRRRLTP